MKKVLVILVILVLVFIPVCAYADTLTLDIKTNNKNIEIGNEINVIVSWNKEMQAADFYLNYDSEKLEYLKSNIDDVFINNEKDNGVLKTAWFSIDDTTKTEIQYTFKIKKSGTANFTTKVYGGFATEKLGMPDNYEEGELAIKISKNPIMIYTIIGVSIIFITIILTIIRRNKNIKRRKQV